MMTYPLPEDNSTLTDSSSAAYSEAGCTVEQVCLYVDETLFLTTEQPLPGEEVILDCLAVMEAHQAEAAAAAAAAAAADSGNSSSAAAGASRRKVIHVKINVSVSFCFSLYRHRSCHTFE